MTSENHEEPEIERAAGRGGLLAATAEPLIQSLGAGLSAASAVLATVFLAGGLVRGDHAQLIAACALAAFSGAAVAAPRWATLPRWKRVRVGLTALGIGGVALIGARGLQAIWGLGRRPVTQGAPDVLLVTLGRAGPMGSLMGAWQGQPTENSLWYGFREVYAASPRRDPSLATLLTGEEPIEHRVLFDGDAPRSGARTLVERLSRAGYETGRFGGTDLPEWSRRGFGFLDPAPAADAAAGGASDEAAVQGALQGALGWLRGGQGQPRFAHLHLDTAAIGPLLQRIDSLPGEGVEVVVASILGDLPGSPHTPGSSPEGPGEDESHERRLAVALWWGSLALPGFVVARPRGLVSVVPTLLARIGLSADEASNPTDDGTPLFGAVRPDEVLVVSMAHAEDGVHWIRAAAVDGVLHVGATPLGAHPHDDWALDGPTQDHFVYRNDVSAQGSASGDMLLDRLVKWRTANGRFETVVQ